MLYSSASELCRLGLNLHAHSCRLFGAAIPSGLFARPVWPSTAHCDSVPERAGGPGQRGCWTPSESQPRFPKSLFLAERSTRSSRESALWNCRSEHMEISDLRLRCGSSLESCGTRELQSAGQQQRLARKPWLPGRARVSWRSRDSQLSQGESRYLGTGYLQQPIHRKCQHHPGLRRQPRGDSVSFTARWKFQDYFLRSGGAVRWRRIHHADYRFRPWRCARDRPSPAQSRS